MRDLPAGVAGPRVRSGPDAAANPASTLAARSADGAGRFDRCSRDRRSRGEPAAISGILADRGSGHPERSAVAAERHLAAAAHDVDGARRRALGAERALLAAEASLATAARTLARCNGIPRADRQHAGSPRSRRRRMVAAGAGRPAGSGARTTGTGERARTADGSDGHDC